MTKEEKKGKRIEELEQEVKYQTEDSKKWQNMYKQRCEEYQKLEKVNAELNKLRCCENCKNVNLQLHWRESEEIDKMRQFVCGTCGNRKNWEYLGKTVGITETQQLTKAKFLLKQLVYAFPKSYSDVVKDTLDEARKFVEE